MKDDTAVANGANSRQRIAPPVDFHFLEIWIILQICLWWADMIVVGAEVIERYFAGHAGQKGIRAARSRYDVWLAIALHSQWRNPNDVKASHPKVSILKGGRVVFNIKGNDCRLVAALQYRAGVLVIRFFGTHAEYDRIDAKTV